MTAETVTEMADRDSATFWRQAADFLGGHDIATAIQESLSLVLCRFDDQAEGKAVVSESSPKAAAMFGRSVEEMKELDVGHLMPEKYRNDHAGFVQQYQQSPHLIQMGERRIPCLDAKGRVFTQTVWLVPVDVRGVQSVLVLFL